MEWEVIKIDKEWEVNQGLEEGKSTGKNILFHIKCPDGVVLPGLPEDRCSECGILVPEAVKKRLPFIVNRDRLMD